MWKHRNDDWAVAHLFSALGADTPSIRNQVRPVLIAFHRVVVISLGLPSVALPTIPIMTLTLSNLTAALQQAMLEGPALMPPPGVQPNFVDPPNQNTLGYALLSICYSISASMVGIRLFARISRYKRMDIEDCTSRIRLVV